MSKELFQLATSLSHSFMPAEQSQSDASLAAAESLVCALKLRANPAFQGGIGEQAIEALSRGVDLAVQADVALREAHRRFARMLPKSGLGDIGWGCTGPECPGARLTEVPHVRAVA